MTRPRRLSALRRWRGLLYALAIAYAPSSGLVAGTYREMIEEDWERQEACRLAEILEPGTVRFVETELAWPGISTDRRPAVPRLPAPSIDGGLDDAAWQDALQLPSASPGLPSALVAQDGERLFAAITLPTALEGCFRGDPTGLDAGGAVDGIKDGKYGFHGGHEPNPWWQVDLLEPTDIARIVIYNRLDYAPGLHNADSILILASDDGASWTRIHDNAGRHFGGVSGGGPLVVEPRGSAAAPGGGQAAALRARFLRIQIPSAAPIFLHLDEVEVYGPGDASMNLALRRPARQSSLSPWSRGGPGGSRLLRLGGLSVDLDAAAPAGVIVRDARGVPIDPAATAAAGVVRAAMGREGDRTVLELELPLRLVGGGFPADVQVAGAEAVAVRGGGPWDFRWGVDGAPGFGRNALWLDLRSEGKLDPPVEVLVETVVFTPARPERDVVFRERFAAAASRRFDARVRAEGAAALLVSVSQGGMGLRDGKAFLVEPVATTLLRAERLAAAFGIGTPPVLVDLRERAGKLAAREAAEGPDPSGRKALHRDARWLAREVAFSNPLLDFDELLVLKRFTQETYPDVCLNHMPWVSRPGGDICILSGLRAREEPSVRPLLAGALGPGHVHGMDLDWDASRVVFGYAKARGSEPPAGWLDRSTSFVLRRTEEPTHIFEVGIDGKGLRQITSGEWSDLDPTYLPNGDIAFASERCGYSLQCNELDKDETSCNLYAMRPDGTGIRRLTVTKDGDYLPHTLDDGTLGYTRWEYQERGWANIQSLWTVRPDGTGADAVFKQHFNDPWAVEEARSIPGSSLLVAIATGHHTLPAGPVVILDPRRGINTPEGIRIVTPGILPPEGGMSGRVVEPGGVRGRGGYCMTPWPLSEEHFLVSRNYGRETEPAGYAIYLADVHGTMELVYRDPQISCFTPIPLRPRPRPPLLPELTEPEHADAICVVANVGRGVEGVAPDSIRYIRIGHRPGWPYTNEFGGERYEPDVKSVMINWTPVRVIGIVPVEPDGSACFRVPVDRHLYFQILDENFMELRRMRSFISFQPGEVRGCMGCHETRTDAPAPGAFPMALLREPSVPVLPPWGDRALSFLRDVQPVLDRHCASCHSGLRPAGGIDLSGGLTARYNRAYDTILESKLIARSNVGDDARITQPLEFGSHKSRLVHVIREGKHAERVKLDAEDWLRLVTWIDGNGPYHDGFINKRSEPRPYDLPSDRDLLSKVGAVHARRCASCHDPAAVTRADWIDLVDPARSPFLAAPLAGGPPGRGRCGERAYSGEDDPDYRTVRELVDAAVREALARPRRDLKALLDDQGRIKSLHASRVER